MDNGDLSRLGETYYVQVWDVFGATLIILQRPEDIFCSKLATHSKRRRTEKAKKATNI